MSQIMKSQIGQQTRPYKEGGSVKHDDVAADRKLVKKMVKGAALTGKACGGAIKKKGAK